MIFKITSMNAREFTFETDEDIFFKDERSIINEMYTGRIYTTRRRNKNMKYFYNILLKSEKYDTIYAGRVESDYCVENCLQSIDSLACAYHFLIEDIERVVLKKLKSGELHKKIMLKHLVSEQV